MPARGMIPPLHKKRVVQSPDFNRRRPWTTPIVARVWYYPYIENTIFTNTVQIEYTYLMNYKAILIEFLSDLSPHTHEELIQVIPSSFAEAVLASVTHRHIIIDGIHYWICEDEEDGVIYYQLTPV